MQTNPNHSRHADAFAAFNATAAGIGGPTDGKPETEAERIHRLSKDAGKHASHITEGHYMAFQALVSGQYREHVMLLSCFVNGKPGVMIAAHREYEYGMAIQPLFLALSDGMHVTSMTGEVMYDGEERQ